MRFWLPIILIIGVMSGLFTWLYIQLGKPGPMWQRADEAAVKPGRLEFAAKQAADYEVKPLKNNTIVVEAGTRLIDTEHTIEVEFENTGEGPVELSSAGSPSCGCVKFIEVNGKPLKPGEAGAVIGPREKASVVIRWKPTERQIPIGPGKGDTMRIPFNPYNDPNFLVDLVIQVDSVPVRPPEPPGKE